MVAVGGVPPCANPGVQFHRVLVIRHNEEQNPSSTGGIYVFAEIKHWNDAGMLPESFEKVHLRKKSALKLGPILRGDAIGQMIRLDHDFPLLARQFGERRDLPTAVDRSHAALPQ